MAQLSGTKGGSGAAPARAARARRAPCRCRSRRAGARWSCSGRCGRWWQTPAPSPATPPANPSCSSDGPSPAFDVGGDLRDQAAEACEQDVSGERRREEIGRAELHGIHGVLKSHRRSQDDDRRARPPLTRPRDQATGGRQGPPSARRKRPPMACDRGSSTPLAPETPGRPRSPRPEAARRPAHRSGFPPRGTGARSPERAISACRKYAETAHDDNPRPPTVAAPRSRADPADAQAGAKILRARRSQEQAPRLARAWQR